MFGGQANRDRDLAGIAGRRNDELRTLARRKGQRDHRIGVSDALTGVAFVDDRRTELPGPIKGQRRHIHALPAIDRLQV